MKTFFKSLALVLLATLGIQLCAAFFGYLGAIHDSGLECAAQSLYHTTCIIPVLALLFAMLPGGPSDHYAYRARLGASLPKEEYVLAGIAWILFVTFIIIAASVGSLKNEGKIEILTQFKILMAPGVLGALYLLIPIVVREYRDNKAMLQKGS